MRKKKDQGISLSEVTGSDVIEATTLIDWSSENKQFFNSKGIYRGTLSELSIFEPFLKYNNFKDSELNFTLLYQVEVIQKETLFFKNIAQAIPNIIILESKINAIDFSRCDFSDFNDGKELITDIYLYNSIAKDIIIEHETNIGNFWIREGSFIKNLHIKRSRINEILIFNTFAGELSLLDNSTINKISIERYSLGGLEIVSSNINELKIFNSKSNFLRIKEGSEIGYIFLKNNKIINISISNSNISNELNLLYCNTRNIKVQNIKGTFNAHFIGSKFLFFLLDRNIFKDFTFRNKTLADLQFYECSIEGFFSITNSKAGNLKLLNETKISSLYMNNSQIGNIEIRNKCSIGSIKIIDGSTSGSLNIKDSEIEDEFSISNSYSEDIYIERSKLGNFLMQDSMILDVDVNDCDVGRFDFTDKGILGDLAILNSRFSALILTEKLIGLSIYKSKINQCILNNCFISRLSIENECEIELYISRGQVNLIDFEQLTLSKKTILSFSKTSIFSCNMNEFSSLGNIYFREIKSAKKTYDFFNIDGYLGYMPSNNEPAFLYQKKETFLLEKKMNMKDLLNNGKKGSKFKNQPLG